MINNSSIAAAADVAPLDVSGFSHQNWSEDLFASSLSEWEDITVGIYLVALELTAVLLNCVVLWVVLRKRELLWYTDYFIVSLAFCDLGAPLFCYPLATASSFAHRWLFGTVGCTISGFLGFFFGLADMVTLAAMSGMRYVTVCRPGGANLITKPKVVGLIVLVYIYTLFWCICPLVGLGGYDVEPFGTSCTIRWKAYNKSYITAVFIGCFVLPLIVIIVCYGFIIHKTRMSARNLGRRPDQSGCFPLWTKQQLHLLKMTGLMTACFLVAWLPYSVVSLVHSYHPHLQVSPQASVVPTLLAKSCHLWNPIVYFILNRKYRHHVPPWLKLSTFLRARCSRTNESYASTYPSTKMVDGRGDVGRTVGLYEPISSTNSGDSPAPPCRSRMGETVSPGVMETRFVYPLVGESEGRSPRRRFSSSDGVEGFTMPFGLVCTRKVGERAFDIQRLINDASMFIQSRLSYSRDTALDFIVIPLPHSLRASASSGCLSDKGGNGPRVSVQAGVHAVYTATSSSPAGGPCPDHPPGNRPQPSSSTGKPTSEHKQRRLIGNPMDSSWLGDEPLTREGMFEGLSQSDNGETVRATKRTVDCSETEHLLGRSDARSSNDAPSTSSFTEPEPSQSKGDAVNRAYSSLSEWDDRCYKTVCSQSSAPKSARRSGISSKNVSFENEVSSATDDDSAFISDQAPISETNGDALRDTWPQATSVSAERPAAGSPAPKRGKLATALASKKGHYPAKGNVGQRLASGHLSKRDKRVSNC